MKIRVSTSNKFVTDTAKYTTPEEDGIIFSRDFVAKLLAWYRQPTTALSAVLTGAIRLFHEFGHTRFINLYQYWQEELALVARDLQLFRYLQNAQLLQPEFYPRYYGKLLQNLQQNSDVLAQVSQKGTNPWQQYQALLQQYGFANALMSFPSDGAQEASVKHVAFVTPEAGPFFKTGGLGDVCGELATALSNSGVQVTIFTYKYEKIEASKLQDTGIHLGVKVGYETLPSYLWTAKNGEVTYYFLEVPGIRKAYEGDQLHFAQGLCEGTLRAIEMLVGSRMELPEVIHVHDWAAALLPVLLKTRYADHPLFKDIATVLTVHNAGHTGAWIPGDRYPELGIGGEHWFGLAQKDSAQHFCLLRGAIFHTDKINTVSYTNKLEMLTPTGSGGLYEDYWARISDFLAIRNGVDYAVWDPVSAQDKPAKKASIQEKYGFEVEPGIPLIGMIARISQQKGVKQVVRVIQRVLRETQGKIQFIYVGQANEQESYGQEATNQLAELQARWPLNVKFLPKGTSTEQKPIFQAIDIFLYPSEFEPFGTKPVVALINSAPGVVRRTGGLADNFQEYQWVSGEGNGWVFENIDDNELHDAVWRALNTFHNPQHWANVTHNAGSKDWSWQEPAQNYFAMYNWACEHANAGKGMLHSFVPTIDKILQYQELQGSFVKELELEIDWHAQQGQRVKAHTDNADARELGQLLEDSITWLQAWQKDQA